MPGISPDTSVNNSTPGNSPFVIPRFDLFDPNRPLNLGTFAGDNLFVHTNPYIGLAGFDANGLPVPATAPAPPVTDPANDLRFQTAQDILRSATQQRGWLGDDGPSMGTLAKTPTPITEDPSPAPMDDSIDVDDETPWNGVKARAMLEDAFARAQSVLPMTARTSSPSDDTSLPSLSSPPALPPSGPVNLRAQGPLPTEVDDKPLPSFWDESVTIPGWTPPAPTPRYTDTLPAKSASDASSAPDANASPLQSWMLNSPIVGEWMNGYPYPVNGGGDGSIHVPHWHLPHWRLPHWRLGGGTSGSADGTSGSDATGQAYGGTSVPDSSPAPSGPFVPSGSAATGGVFTPSVPAVPRGSTSVGSGGTAFPSYATSVMVPAPVAPGAASTAVGLRSFGSVPSSVTGVVPPSVYRNGQPFVPPTPAGYPAVPTPGTSGPLANLPTNNNRIQEANGYGMGNGNGYLITPSEGSGLTGQTGRSNDSVISSGVPVAPRGPSVPVTPTTRRPPAIGPLMHPTARPNPAGLADNYVPPSLAAFSVTPSGLLDVPPDWRSQQGHSTSSQSWKPVVDFVENFGRDFADTATGLLYLPWVASDVIGMDMRANIHAWWAIYDGLTGNKKQSKIEEDLVHDENSRLAHIGVNAVGGDHGLAAGLGLLAGEIANATDPRLSPKIREESAEAANATWNRIFHGVARNAKEHPFQTLLLVLPLGELAIARADSQLVEAIEAAQKAGNYEKAAELQRSLIAFRQAAAMYRVTHHQAQHMFVPKAMEVVDSIVGKVLGDNPIFAKVRRDAGNLLNGEPGKPYFSPRPKDSVEPESVADAYSKRQSGGFFDRFRWSSQDKEVLRKFLKAQYDSKNIEPLNAIVRQDLRTIAPYLNVPAEWLDNAEVVQGLPVDGTLSKGAFAYDYDVRADARIPKVKIDLDTLSDSYPERLHIVSHEGAHAADNYRAFQALGNDPTKLQDMRNWILRDNPINGRIIKARMEVAVERRGFAIWKEEISKGNPELRRAIEDAEKANDEVLRLNVQHKTLYAPTRNEPFAQRQTKDSNLYRDISSANKIADAAYARLNELSPGNCPVESAVQRAG